MSTLHWMYAIFYSFTLHVGLSGWFKSRRNPPRILQPSATPAVPLNGIVFINERMKVYVVVVYIIVLTCDVSSLYPCILCS